MNSDHPLLLEDVQKKLSLFRKHLDTLLQGAWQSEDGTAEEVLAVVVELESLIEWATQQPELKVESGLLLDNLQLLHNIRQKLRKHSAEKEQLSTTDAYCIADKSEEYLKELPEDETVNRCNSLEKEQLNVDLLSLNQVLPENPIEDDTVLYEDPFDNTVLSKNPTDINTVLTDNTTDISTVLAENTIDIDKILAENRSDINKILAETPVDVSKFSSAIEKNVNINVISNFLDNLNINLNTVEHNENTNMSPVSTKSEETKIVSLKKPEINTYNRLQNEIIILETNEDNKISEVINDPKCSNDPLDICMCAIKNLYESLRVKENELLKLSVIQNDQKHIAALQEVIINFHKDITNLNSQLEQTKKENKLLKEQVLELEEAENDARLAAQNFEQKLVFLQEKDSHSQAEIHQLKQNLKNSAEMLVEKEVSEKELRSQLKYMETLIQKYEDQIRSMELKQKEIQMEHENQPKIEKGTQTYVPPLKYFSKLHEIPENNETCSNSSTTENYQSSNNQQVVSWASEVEAAECDNEQPINKNMSLLNPLEDQIAHGANLSQKDLLKRLYKLIDDDAELQQQIHNVDQINLAMWMKLKSLENDIGKCKRENINESDSTTELQCYQIMPDHAIPMENIISLDQNEQSIQERLLKLEEINALEKDISSRHKLCEDKEKKTEEWKEMEEIFRRDLQHLAKERENLMDQVLNLKKEKEELEQRVLQQQAELNMLKEKNQNELNKIRVEQETMTVQLHQKVKQLLSKEKEHLKMITNLKSERNSAQDKTELERLKSSYIELQLELSHSRDEIKKLEEDFKVRLDECMKMHKIEETQLSSELDHLRKENANCDKMINDLQSKQVDLLDALKQQEKNLELARKHYKKNLENTEEHRSVETGLKSQLREIEEGTAIVAAVLTEERQKAEEELKENIKDLREKEDSYKMKIAELEDNVKHLHQELDKIGKDSESITQENATNELDEDTHTEPAKDHSSLPSEPINKLNVVNLTSAPQQPFNPPPPMVKSTNKEISADKRSEVAAEIDKAAENVDQLRAQVRRLQTHLEKISNSDLAEMSLSSVKPASPINTFSMGIPKEDLDYAEIEECTGIMQGKQSNMKEIKKISQNVQKSCEDQSASEYRSYALNENSSMEQANEENDYDEVLPRPTNFHVVQQVGSDTLLVGWNYINPSVLDGFEVYLGNEVHERIYIPDRTKALISGLDLRKPISLSIYALSRYGQMSEPAVLELSPHQKSTKYFEDNEEGDDYKGDLQNAEQQRPYSMEW